MDIEGEEGEEGEEGDDEEEEEEFVPIVGVHIDMYGRRVQPNRNPYTGQYIGREARAARPKRVRENAYVRTGGYQPREARPARQGYTPRPQYVPDRPEY